LISLHVVLFLKFSVHFVEGKTKGENKENESRKRVLALDTQKKGFDEEKSIGKVSPCKNFALIVDGWIPIWG
jgi:hypothetical protein